MNNTYAWDSNWTLELSPKAIRSYESREFRTDLARLYKITSLMMDELATATKYKELGSAEAKDKEKACAEFNELLVELNKFNTTSISKGNAGVAASVIYRLVITMSNEFEILLRDFGVIEVSGLTDNMTAVLRRFGFKTKFQ